MGLLGRGCPSPPARGMEERCKFPERGPGPSPGHQRFSYILNKCSGFRMTFQDSKTMDHGDFTFLAPWPSGRARGTVRMKMVGPIDSTLSIASAATGDHTSV